MAIATLYTELDLDTSKFVAKQKKLLDDIKKVGADSETALQRSFMNLGVTSDSVYKLMVEKVRVSYEQITQSGKVSAAEQVRAQQAMVAQINAINAKMAEGSNAHYATLGMKSAASINEQIANVQRAAIAQQAIVGKSSADWIRIERAKNAKLKELNAEMAGSHEMSMASMTRAVLRFYAAYYVISNVVRYVTDFFMGGVKAIDDMKVSVVSVAAQITSMQGTTGDVAQNYKDNVKYAEALIPVLQRIDANSFANLSQILKMNMAMTNQGVILDVNNKKQIESFTALTNAVALFTQGQDKEKQATQEIRSLMSGRIRAGDMVAMQMDALVKKQGDYKGGLQELVKEGKKHGDTLERMQPYLIGIVAASGDIQKTWMAVGTSIETVWNIIQRGLFKDAYKLLVESGMEATKWLKANQDEIVQYIKIAWGFISDLFMSAWNILKGFGPLLKDMAMLLAPIAYGWGGVLAALKPIGEAIGNAIESTYLLGKAIVSTALAATMLAKLDTEGAKLYWDEAKKGYSEVWRLQKKNFDLITTGVADSIVAYDKQYQAAKKAAQGAIEVPKVKPTIEAEKDSVKDHMEILRAKMQADKAYYDEQVKTAEQVAKLSQRAGQDEYKTIKDLYDSKEIALNNYLEVEYANAEKLVALEKQKALIGKDEASRKFDAELVLQAKYDAIYAKYNKEWAKYEGDRAIANEDAVKKTVSTMAALYSVIAQYSKQSIDFQIKLLEEKYLQEGRYTKGSLALAIALKVEEDRLYENADKFWADYYSNIDGYANASYERKLSWIEKVRQAEIAAANAGIKSESQKVTEVGAANAKANQAIITAIGDKFDQENKYTKQVITNTASMLDAAMTMYDKDSSEYKRLAEWKKGVQMAQLALDVARNATIIASNLGLVASNTSVAMSAAGSSIAGASIGVGPTGFATAAAMIALLAGVFAMYGIAGGGGSASVSAPTLPASTVLGAETGTASASLENSQQLLEDMHAEEYGELQKIYKEIVDLNRNITGLVSGLVRTYGNFSKGLDVGELGDKLGDFEKSANLYILQNAGFLTTIGKFLNQPIVDIGNWLFGGGSSREITSAGISLSPATIKALNDGSVTAMRYAIVKTTTKGWFGSTSDSSSRTEDPATEEITRLFTNIYRSLGKSMIEVSKIFGTDVQKVLDYMFPAVDLNLYGLSAEDATKKLQAWISETGDVMAKALFENLVGKYQKVGEGLYETTIRVAADLAFMTQTMAMLGVQFKGTTAQLIEWSEAMIDAAGGLDKLQEGLGAYYDYFFTESEKHIIQLELLSKQMAEFNMVLPETAAGFRELVQAIDLSTEEGRMLMAFLVGMMPSIVEFYSYADELANKHRSLEIELLELLGSKSEALALSRKMELEAMDESLWAIQEMIWALTDAQDALDIARSNLQAAFAAESDKFKKEIDTLNESLTKTNEIISELKGYVDKLKSARESMRLEDNEFERNRYKNAQLALAVVLGQARGGVFSGLKDIDNTLSILTQSNTDLYINSTAYKRDFWKTYLSIAELESLTGTQLTAEEQIAANTKAQIDAANKQIELLQEQLDAILNVNNSVLSLAEATSQYQAALASFGGAQAAARAELTKPYTPPSSGYESPAEEPKKKHYIAPTTWHSGETTDDIWEDVFGRFNLAHTKQFGIPMNRPWDADADAMAAKMRLDTEYSILKGGYAEGGSHSGGWRLVGERGPELEFTGPSNIISNQKSKALVDNVALIEEVRKLRAELKASNYQLVKNSSKMARALDLAESEMKTDGILMRTA